MLGCILLELWKFLDVVFEKKFYFRIKENVKKEKGENSLKLKFCWIVLLIIINFKYLLFVWFFC